MFSAPSLQIMIDYKWRQFGIFTFLRSFSAFLCHLVICTAYNYYVTRPSL